MSSDREENLGSMRHEKRVRGKFCDIRMPSISRLQHIMKRSKLLLMVGSRDCNEKNHRSIFVISWEKKNSLQVSRLMRHVSLILASSNGSESSYRQVRSSLLVLSILSGLSISVNISPSSSDYSDVSHILTILVSIVTLVRQSHG